MAQPAPIKVKLFVVLGDGHLGPIDLTIFPHNTPEKLTAFEMNDPLAIPAEMRTRTQRFLFSMRKRSMLKSRDGFGHQGVSNGDILVLTDLTNEGQVLALSDSLANQTGVRVTVPNAQETRLKAVIRGSLEGIPWVGPALAALIFGPKGGG
jgi:hypothetical protein